MLAAREITLQELIDQLPPDHKAREEYNKLVSDGWFLDCLRGAGVDNWDGYGDAQDMFSELGEKL
jgi:hypothetical protein